MYTAVWDDYEDDDENLATPYNQMAFFQDLDPLPQFEHLTDDLL
jgi:hypothetical protein